jgi:hypothetical protein
MKFSKRSKEDSWVPTILAIGFGFVCGLILAAIMNRTIGFFFYCTFIGSIFSGFVAAVILTGNKKGNKLRSLRLQRDIVLTIILTILLSFSFLATVPLNVDRSFSVWLLNQMSNNQTSLTRVDLEVKAQDFFNAQNGEISRRVDEQIKLGTIKKVSQDLRLTKRGIIQIEIHRLVAKFFGLTPKYTENGVGY